MNHHQQTFVLNQSESVKFPGLDELFNEDDEPEAVPEYRPRIMTLWSRAKIGTLQSRLDMLQQQVNGKFNYSNRLIMKLANDVFGFEGWSTKIIHHEACLVSGGQEETGGYSVNAWAIVRITLKDGTFYETKGIGKSHNLPEKGLAFRTAKMLAVTTAIKFGIMELPILTIDDEIEYGTGVIKQEQGIVRDIMKQEFQQEIDI